jgi:hypothetical protein
MNELMQRERVTADVQEKVLLGGDLSKLTPAERLSYYNAICDSMQLNPLTRPFEYIVLNGKLVLYARKDCTEQLRKRDNVSVSITAREHVEGVYVVTARATIYGDSPLGQVALRSDESIGAVPLENLKGEAKANAMMKAETKAKRRVTLSISGLGMLDETEIDSIPDARRPIESTAAAALANKEKMANMNKPEPQAAGTSQEAPPPQASDRAPAPTDDSPAFIWRVGKKHAGESVRTIPDDYLTWFAENGKAADHVQAANDEIDRRMGQANIDVDYEDRETQA